MVKYTSKNSTVHKAEIDLYEPYQSVEIFDDCFPKKYASEKNCANKMLACITKEGNTDFIGAEIPSQLVIWFDSGGSPNIHRRRFHMNKNWKITKVDSGYWADVD
jgi:hypothetical protein